jgi:membrane AbrB-like protein
MDNWVLNLPMTLALVFLLGFLGYRTFKFFNIPGGTIIGALVMVALVSSLGVRWAAFPSKTSLVFQIVLGIALGCKFSKERVPYIKTLFIPGLFAAAWMICISLGVGVFLAKVTDIDIGTALFGSVPGGVSEMSLIALTYNLNMPVVALLQFVRAVSVLIITPLIAARYSNTSREVAASKGATPDGEIQRGTVKEYNLFITLTIGAIAGYTADFLGIPVGGLLGAMGVVAVLRIVGVHLKEIPRWILVTAQIGLGGFLGTSFTPNVVATLQSLLVPTLVFSLVIVLNGLVLGFLAHKIFGWDLTTSLLACAAAGYTQMSVIALEMEADVVTVSIVQALRATIILSVMPTAIILLFL